MLAILRDVTGPNRTSAETARYDGIAITRDDKFVFALGDGRAGSAAMEKTMRRSRKWRETEGTAPKSASQDGASWLKPGRETVKAPNPSMAKWDSQM